MKFEKQLDYWTHMLDEAFAATPTIGNIEYLTEGMHWPNDFLTKTQKKLASIPLFARHGGSDAVSQAIEQDSRGIITTFDPQAFTDKPHMSNALASYYWTFVNWLVEYSTYGQTTQANSSQKQPLPMSQQSKHYTKFMDVKKTPIVQALKDIVSDPAKDRELRQQIKKMTVAEFENLVSQLEQQNASDEANMIASQSFSGEKQYDVIHIKSYDQLHAEFGGGWTGNGTGDETAWCHTNNISVYDEWIANGSAALVVLAKHNWKDIKFPQNPTNPDDEYGSSLIALLVNTTTGRLARSTTRYNHILVRPGRTADSAFKHWGDLNAFCKQDIKTEVLQPLQEIMQEKNSKAQAANQLVSQALQNATKVAYNTIPSEARKFVTKIDVPSSVTAIDRQGFANCFILEELNLPDSIQAIPAFAFSNCYNLTTIHLPSSTTSIGSRAFESCKSVEQLELPNGLTTIREEAFFLCNSMQHISIPDTVSYIGVGAFGRCTVLEDVKLPSSLTQIQQAVFADCQGLKHIELPPRLKQIGAYAMVGCVMLEDIEIPDTVESIAANAFFHCHSLKSVKLPSSLTVLQSGVFSNCTSLEHVEIPQGVTSIPSSAFANCKALKTIAVHTMSQKQQVERILPHVEVQVLNALNEDRAYNPHYLPFI